MNQVVKHGGGSTMLWGCLTCTRLGSCIIYKGTRMLEATLQDLCSTLLAFGFNLEEIIFQHTMLPCIQPRLFEDGLGSNRLVF